MADESTEQSETIEGQPETAPLGGSSSKEDVADTNPPPGGEPVSQGDTVSPQHDPSTTADPGSTVVEETVQAEEAPQQVEATPAGDEGQKEGDTAAREPSTEVGSKFSGASLPGAEQQGQKGQSKQTHFKSSGVDVKAAEEAEEEKRASTFSLSMRKSSLRVSSIIVEHRGSKDSAAKAVVGSVVSIKRTSFTGEGGDRAKIARYANTYKLESDNPFNPEKVQKILETVMTEALDNLTYDPEKVPKQAKWASSAIRTRVKDLEFDRYKLICLVTIGEKNSQDVIITCRFLWDADRDRYATFSLENTYVFGLAQCFGLYYE